MEKVLSIIRLQYENEEGERVHPITGDNDNVRLGFPILSRQKNSAQDSGSIVEWSNCPRDKTRADRQTYAAGSVLSLQILWCARGYFATILITTSRGVY